MSRLSRMHALRLAALLALVLAPVVSAQPPGFIIGIGMRGSTCLRRIKTVLDADGKFVSTSASCADGVTICPPAPKPPKKGK